MNTMNIKVMIEMNMRSKKHELNKVLKVLYHVW